MKVASLFSGGKDSTYALYLAKKDGHSIACLITLIPYSDESYLFHYPNIWITKSQSELLRIPILENNIFSDKLDNEYSMLYDVIKQAKEKFDIEGIVHGGIRSKFQKKFFTNACIENNLELISPLWDVDQYRYMEELLKNKFVIQIVGVSAMGLDKTWLGKVLHFSDLKILFDLSKKYEFNVSFEGGEAETLVIDCPIFHKKLKIINSNIKWDGQRGIVEISEIALLDK